MNTDMQITIAIIARRLMAGSSNTFAENTRNSMTRAKSKRPTE